MSEKFFIVNSKVLPDVFQKVIQVKELIYTEEVKDISEGVKEVGISRSAYYKYKDNVFSMSENMKGQKATIALLIAHESGTLSKILDKIAENKGNIMTINQDIPINNAANVTITFDISKMEVDMKNILEEIKTIDNVIKVKLIALE
ncbi:ACT domain-containing protein [Clostridium algidicarnis]|uniref:ACT domain-containing protein n=1 Tax=Clostridium algidicarnis TaxID=37659 RepID=UPI001C0CF654|nr:ACT domain-containing protein [Clostridium algidicarnis]MBU3204614.1 ACT domain-containing protein [Clostridium algidicarnis]MBU3212901.1 ACT domain-containing protein [Clostridium algidicarnis]MBU3223545.1 ACT domain-containing protein [Clostridium algidicarnis]